MDARSTTKKLKQALIDDRRNKARNSKDSVKAAARKSQPEEISASQFTFNEDDMLGEGSFAVVYKGEYQNKTVAVKKILSEPDEDAHFKSQQVAIMNELNKLGAPHVIQLYAYTATVLPYYLIMPLMNQGSLFACIDMNIQLSDNLRYQVLVGVAKALAFMHDHLFIHRDIKPDNVLLDENFVPYLTDFDSAVKLDPKTMAISSEEGMFGTPMYVAPELVEDGPYTTASDVYAFTILMWEVLAWKPAYEDQKSELLTMLKVKGGYREEIPEDWPKTMAALIRFGWHQDKSKRLSMNKMQEELEVERERLSLTQ